MGGPRSTRQADVHADINVDLQVDELHTLWSVVEVIPQVGQQK